MSTLNTYNLKSPDSANTNIALDASGNVAIQAGSASTPSIYVTGDPNTGLYSPGADQVAISTGGSGRLFVDASGNVKVGSTDNSNAATQYITVGSVGVTDGGLQLWARTNGQSYVQFGDTTTSADQYRGYLQYSHASDFLALGTASQERLRITSAGLVGVGTSTVDELLHLKGASAASTTLKVESTATASERSSIHFFNGSVSRGRVGGSNDFDGLTLDSSTTESAAAIRFRTGGTSLTTKMTLTSGGSLGIGNDASGFSSSLIVGSGSGDNGATIYSGTSSQAYLHFADGTSGADRYRGGIVYNHTNNSFSFATNDLTALTIDSSQRVLVGTSSDRNNFRFQVEGSGFEDSTISITRNANNVGAPAVYLAKSRGTTAGSRTIVSSGDGLGAIWMQGSDGTNDVRAAGIEAYCDGTPGTNDMPGRLVFSTTSDGASSPTERMRISNGGAIYQNFASRRDTGNDFSQFAYTGTNPVLELYAANGSFANNDLLLTVNRAATSAYQFLSAYSSGVADLEFSLYGDGNGKCDGAWTGGGADYAEYFEWSDNNPEAEDRRGISVVLDGDKIREAVAGEDPIGVISGNPSVVGDAAWNKWSGKYLRDEFGTYIQEDYEVVNDEGETVVQQRRKLNPAYDPDQEYISREQRPEWDCVGLMGKLRIRKGQVTGSRWTKMRDISDSVEEWLVR